MASGHANRINRPNTWLHRPMLRVKIRLANQEPSTHGTKRTLSQDRPTVRPPDTVLERFLPLTLHPYTRSAPVFTAPYF